MSYGCNVFTHILPFARASVLKFVQQLEEIDHGANAHVETLARLDLVKTNMGDCLHTLTEAASWNALVREVNTG